MNFHFRIGVGSCEEHLLYILRIVFLPSGIPTKNALEQLLFIQNAKLIAHLLEKR